jgi:hypothetical protein
MTIEVVEAAVSAAEQGCDFRRAMYFSRSEEF